LYTDNRIWIVDLSALDTSALYIRLARTFPQSATVDQIAEILANEQRTLLEMLNLEIAEKENGGS
jgi:hypothetical protein